MAANTDIPDLSADSVIPSTSINPDPQAVADANNSLDAILKQVAPQSQEAESIKPQGDPAPKDPPAPPAATTTTPAAPAAPAPAATPAATPAAPSAPVTTETPAAPAATPASTTSPDDYKSIQLPPYAKPATTEAFERVKTLAGVKIDTLVRERDELAAKLKEADAKAGKLPAETEQELNELRTFRKKLDVEYDPSFKQYDTQVTQNDESILVKLKEAKVTDEVIGKIKEIGVGNVDWDSVLDKLPSSARRFIEAKLTQNDELRDQKARALDNAKKNADQFLSDREKKGEAEAKEEQAQIKKDFDELLGKFEWSKRREVAPTATAEEKSAAADHNKFLDEVQSAVADATEDNSPRMKAILTLGYCRMLALQRQVAAHDSALAAQQAAWTAEKAKFEATIKEQQAFIDRIKRASGGSSHSVPAIPGQTTQPKVAIDEPGSQALDRLLVETTPA